MSKKELSRQWQKVAGLTHCFLFGQSRRKRTKTRPALSFFSTFHFSTWHQPFAVWRIWWNLQDRDLVAGAWSWALHRPGLRGKGTSGGCQSLAGRLTFTSSWWISTLSASPIPNGQSWTNRPLSRTSPHPLLGFTARKSTLLTSSPLCLGVLPLLGHWSSWMSRCYWLALGGLPARRRTPGRWVAEDQHWRSTHRQDPGHLQLPRTTDHHNKAPHSRPPPRNTTYILPWWKLWYTLIYAYNSMYEIIVSESSCVGSSWGAGSDTWECPERAVGGQGSRPKGRHQTKVDNSNINNNINNNNHDMVDRRWMKEPSWLGIARLTSCLNDFQESCGRYLWPQFFQTTFSSNNWKTLLHSPIALSTANPITTFNTEPPMGKSRMNNLGNKNSGIDRLWGFLRLGLQSSLDPNKSFLIRDKSQHLNRWKRTQILKIWCKKEFRHLSTKKKCNWKFVPCCIW